MSNLENLRVSEAEREEASERLAEHYATGRLSDDDYFERLDAVWSARVRADLDMLFTDLPAAPPPPPPRARRRPRAFPLVACFLLVAMGLVVMGVPWWVLAIVAAGAFHFSRSRRRHRSGHRRHHMAYACSASLGPSSGIPGTRR